VARVKKGDDKEERLKFNKIVGENIRNAYKGAGYTQKDFTKLIGITNPTLQSWVQGTKTADIFYLCKICEILEIDINFILNNNNFINKFKNEDIEILKEIIEERKKEKTK